MLALFKSDLTFACFKRGDEMPVIGFFLCSLKLEQEIVAEKYDRYDDHQGERHRQDSGLGRGEEARSSKFRLSIFSQKQKPCP
jgi:hypothetical protein